MTNVNVQLPDELNDKLGRLVDAELYLSKSEAVRDAIRQLPEPDKRRVKPKSKTLDELRKRKGDREE